jgi:hypothetical protein
MTLNEVVGGIYSPQPLPSRWQRLLAMGAPDSYCSLSGARHISVSVRVWSSWPLEPFVFLLHRTVRWPLTSALWLCRDTIQHCSSAQSIVGAQGVVAPLAHRIVRWHTGQSGELWWSAPEETREWHVCLLAGLVHQTVSGVPNISTL